MNKFKKLLPGIVIGVVVALIGVVVWDNVQAHNAEKQASAFLSGIEGAKDKSAFIKSYDFGSAAGLSISNSSADDGGYCDRLGAQINGINEYINILYEMINRSEVPEIREDLADMIRYLGFENTAYVQDYARNCLEPAYN